MTMLTATALITARDEASAVFRRVAAAARQASGVYQSATNSFAAASQKATGALSMAVPTALGVGMFGRATYEWDRAVHRYKAISEVNDDTWARIQEKIMDVSNALGISKDDLLDTVKGWVEIGGQADKVIPILERFAVASRIMGISPKEAMQESRSLVMAFGQDPNDPNAVLDMDNFFVVASKMMRGGGQALVEGLKNAAPIAGGFAHFTKEQTAAMLATMADAGFDAGEGGNAIKSTLMRIFAAPKDSLVELQAAGVHREKLFSMDDQQLQNVGSLEGRLRANNVEISPVITEMLKRDLASVTGKSDMSDVADKLTHDLTDALVETNQLKRNDLRARQQVRKLIDNHLQSSIKSVDYEEFFNLKNIPKSAFVRLFGKEHGAKIWEVLINKAKTDLRLDKFEHDKAGALDRKGSIFFRDFAFEWDRVRTSIDNFFTSVGGSGIKEDFVGIFKTISQFFRDMQTADPQKVRDVFLAIAGVAALAPAGYVLSGIASSLGLIKDAANFLSSNPIAITVVGAYLLYEAYENWDKLKELAKDPLKFNVIFPEAPHWLKWLAGTLNDATATGDDQLKRPGAYSQGMPDWYNRWMFGEQYTSKYYQVPEGGLPRLSLLQGLPQDRMDFGDGFRRIRDIDGPQHLQIKGSADVRVQNEITVKVEGDGKVTKKTGRGGTAHVPLNTGKGMLDSGPSR